MGDTSGLVSVDPPTTVPSSLLGGCWNTHSSFRHTPSRRMLRQSLEPNEGARQKGESEPFWTRQRKGELTRPGLDGTKDGPLADPVLRSAETEEGERGGDGGGAWMRIALLMMAAGWARRGSRRWRAHRERPIRAGRRARNLIPIGASAQTRMHQGSCPSLTCVQRGLVGSFRSSVE